MRDLALASLARGQAPLRLGPPNEGERHRKNHGASDESPSAAVCRTMYKNDEKKKKYEELGDDQSLQSKQTIADPWRAPAW
jgi:hypothetical protein